MAHFILIHGGMHGGWCWERIVPLLEEAGHTAQAPDLPGMGADRTPFAPDIMRQWTDAMAERVRATPEPPIVVGHSRAGVTLSDLGERLPDRIAMLVYLAAVLQPDGKGMGDMVTDFPDSGAAKLAGGVQVDEARGVLTMTDLAAAKEGFYNMCSSADADAGASRLCPEPLAIMAAPVRITPQRYGRVPRAYIETEFDHAMPLSLQRAMQAVLPCDPVITLPTDHSPFYSAPRACADALLALVKAAPS